MTENAILLTIKTLETGEQMSIQLLNKNTDVSDDTDTLEKSLRRHRMKKVGIVGGVLLAMILAALGFYINLQNKTYETYEVIRSFERADTVMTQYTEFLDYVLKYGKDGISCVDSNNKSIWSQTYNMQTPIVEVCQGSVALAEENGTDAMIFDQTGLQGTIQTRLPIRQISVSSQGVLAVLLEDGDIMRLNLYDKKGEELVTSKFELQDTGYPLRMSLSADGTKLAVTFLQVKDGGISTCLAFYNFDSVGENQQDHMVAAKEIPDMVMPSVKYIDETHCFAVGTTQILLYEGKQIPELVTGIELDGEVESIFYSEKYLGVVQKGEEQDHLLKVYDIKGQLKFQTFFDLDYTALKFSGDNILIYNEFECMMLNDAGKIFFQGTFEESVSNLYTLSGRSKYIIMHASRTDQIRLQ